jgi:VanZ family protein
MRMKIETCTRAGFWMCVLIILVLSLAPGSLRPHTAASGHVEHFIAYAGTGLMFAAGARFRDVIFAGIGLSALSGVMELAQLYIPGRTGELPGFLWSSAGAWAGLAAGAIAWSLWRRRASAL